MFPTFHKPQIHHSAFSKLSFTLLKAKSYKKGEEELKATSSIAVTQLSAKLV